MRAKGAFRTAALVCVAVGVAAPVVRRRLGLRPAVVTGLVWQAPFALAVALPPSRRRGVAMYALQMWAYVAMYEMPNDDPERLRARLHVEYPIRVDRVIGLGETPTVRLQRALYEPDEVGAHDVVLAITHGLWYLMPHASILYVLWRRPERFPAAAGRVAAVFDLGLLGYWLVPTAPPWWAGETGATAPVRRILFEAAERHLPRTKRSVYALFGGNPFAAMPSLHFATSVMAAHVLQETGRGAAALGWAYTGTLGFALVYLGEHYVIDLLVGTALAEGVRRGSPRVGPAIGAVARSIRRLEPHPA